MQYHARTDICLTGGVVGLSRTVVGELIVIVRLPKGSAEPLFPGKKVILSISTSGFHNAIVDHLNALRCDNVGLALSDIEEYGKRRIVRLRDMVRIITETEPSVNYLSNPSFVSVQ